MEAIKESIDFFLQFKDFEIDWQVILTAFIITLIFLFIRELYKRKKHSIKPNIEQLLVTFGISATLEFLVLWIFGKNTLIIAIILGFIGTKLIKEKYFKFEENKYSIDELEQQNELKRLENRFSKTPNFSILEVLLYYDYISLSQKEMVETENIFESPDEIAKQFLSKPILTEDQLKEATSIMNIIRINGHILTKQDALLLVSKLQERRGKTNESNSVGGDSE